MAKWRVTYNVYYQHGRRVESKAQIMVEVSTYRGQKPREPAITAAQQLLGPEYKVAGGTQYSTVPVNVEKIEDPPRRCRCGAEMPPDKT